MLSPSANYDSCESFITNYNWTFYGSDSINSILSSPINILFDQIGSNSVVLEAVNQCGIDKDSISFDIHPSPIITLNTND